MITSTLLPALLRGRLSLRVGAGALALVLSSAAVSSAQQGNPPAVTNPEPAPTAQPPVAPRQPAPEDATRASSETEKATQAMQAELEPTPGGLTAQESVKLALENSPALRKYEIDVTRAETQRARQWLSFLPRIDANVGYTRLSEIKLPPFDVFSGLSAAAREMLMLPPPGAAVDSPFDPILNQWAVNFQVSVPITDIFLTVLPGYKGAKKLAKVSAQQRDAQKLQVAYDTRVAFWDYARQRGNVSVARASVRVRESALRDLQALVAAGTATQTELVRAQGELESAKATEVQAQGGVEVALERLVQALGVKIDDSRGIGEPFVNIDVGETPQFDAVLGTARKARPELLALASLKEARELLLRSRKGAYLPKLNANFADQYAKPNQRFIPPLDEWRNTWSVGAVLGWSPNDAALAHTQVKDALSDLEQVHEDQRLLEQGIAIEVAQAVSNHRAAVQTIEATTQQLEAARRYEADQRALLLAGAATPNDLLLAQRDLLAASINWINAYVSGRIAQAALLKAAGETGLGN